jgi:hypothetical protein
MLPASQTTRAGDRIPHSEDAPTRMTLYKPDRPAIRILNEPTPEWMTKGRGGLLVGLGQWPYRNQQRTSNGLRVRSRCGAPDSNPRRDCATVRCSSQTGAFTQQTQRNRAIGASPQGIRQSGSNSERFGTRTGVTGPASRAVGSLAQASPEQPVAYWRS